MAGGGVLCLPPAWVRLEKHCRGESGWEVMPDRPCQEAGPREGSRLSGPRRLGGGGTGKALLVQVN